MTTELIKEFMAIADRSILASWANQVEAQTSQTTTIENLIDSKDFDAINRNRNQSYQIQ